MTHKPPILMVVEDDDGVAEIVQSVAASLGFDTEVFATAKSFMSGYKRNNPDVVVIDIVMPEIEGTELVRWLAENSAQSTVILMTGFRDQYLQHARKIGEAKGLPIYATLKKPFGIAELEDVLQRFLSGT